MEDKRASKEDDQHQNGSPKTPTEVASTTKSSPHTVTADTFEKIQLIGKGDVGKVYLVRHKETKAYYAMKVLDKHEMIRRNKVKRALTEREILATAEHPFIVTLYWCFQSPDKLYFIMDYCAGGEFFRMLQRQPGKCLPEESVKFYAAEVLLALEYLHMRGFIYRDLKPENILLHESGHIMLTDFDLSKQDSTMNLQVVQKMFSKVGGDVYGTPETQSNSFVGTAEYIAPEIIKGYGQSSSVDWWCFGILIYEMLFGATPFKGKSQDDTFSKILDAELDFPENHAYTVTSTCKSLIKKLLSLDPKKRLGSQHGAADVKKHKWFDKLSFTLIRNMTPPIIPKISGPADTSNFRTIKDEEEAPNNGDTKSKGNPDEQFENFKPISKPRKLEGVQPKSS